MLRDRQIKSFVFFSGNGCLLPLLAIFNLLFGWIFLKPKEWLIIEAILLLLFIINSYIIARKIVSSTTAKRRDDAIDVKAEILQEAPRQKH